MALPTEVLLQLNTLALAHRKAFGRNKKKKMRFSFSISPGNSRDFVYIMNGDASPQRQTIWLTALACLLATSIFFLKYRYGKIDIA